MHGHCCVRRAFLLEATARFVRSTTELPGVGGLITSTPADGLPVGLAEHLAGHWRIDDTLDAQQIAAAVTGLSRQLGPVDRLVGALEQLQEPLAVARQMLGIEGMDAQTARNVRDKARMKSVLRAAGVPCARHQLVHHPAEAVAFAEEVGFPLVAKPPAEQVRRRLFGSTSPPHCRSGCERSRPARTPRVCWKSSWSGRSTPSTASPSMVARCGRRSLITSRRRWRSCATVDAMGGDAAARHQRAGVRRHPRGWPAALTALGVRDAFTHMEWFRRPDGTVAVSEVAARPPGAQLTSMHGYAHDMDLYRAWAELVVLDRFEPRERRYAAGRCICVAWAGAGSGPSTGWRDTARAGAPDCRVPAATAQPTSSTYLGEGYVMVRHPDTAVVRDALTRIVSRIRVELVEAL